MITVDVDKIQAMNNTVILDIKEMPEYKNGIYQPDKKGGHYDKVNYKGTISNVGEFVPTDYKIGDTAIVSKFSGAHVSAGKKRFIKCMPFTDIYITYPGDMITKDNLIVHQERLVVELIEKGDTNESGVYEGNVDTKDPRELDMETGRVLRVSPTVSLDVREGDIVAFELHCGTPFEDSEGNLLKSIHELDIKFKA